jgi:hypothetical protein
MASRKKPPAEDPMIREKKEGRGSESVHNRIAPIRTSRIMHLAKPQDDLGGKNNKAGGSLDRCASDAGSTSCNSESVVETHVDLPREVLALSSCCMLSPLKSFITSCRRRLTQPYLHVMFPQLNRQTQENKLQQRSMRLMRQYLKAPHHHLHG